MSSAELRAPHRSLAWNPLVWLAVGLTLLMGVVVAGLARRAASVEALKAEVEAFNGSLGVEAGGPEWLGSVLSDDTRRRWMPTPVSVSTNRGEPPPDDAWLAKLNRFPSLRDLSLDESRVTGNGLAALRELNRLDDVRLWGSPTGDDGWEHLARMPALRRVAAGYTGTTDVGLRLAGTMTRLEYLGVRGCPVTDEGLASIAGLTELTGLYLGETQITDAGLLHLSRMTKLESLWLHNTEITDAGLSHLRPLKSLRRLSLGRTFVTAEGTSWLEETLPGLRIEYRDTRPALPRRSDARE